QAAAVAGIVTGDLAVPVPYRTRLIVALATAGIGAAIALFLSPAVGVAVLGISLLVVFVACAAVLATGQWLPASVPMLAMLAATIEGQVVRFYAVDRRRNVVERAFGHYLAPAIVDSLADENETLQLGGELRHTTIMFADLTGFTAASETLSPAALVEIVNRYFAEIVAAIDQHQGYVDKFIGDSVMAIWGAPARITDPPDQALTCAFAINRQIARIHARETDSRVVKFSLKIGMSTGSVIVGNVGAPHRLNYSVMGEAVNVAARLEKACSDFDCAIVIDQTTATAVGEKFLLCEIDSVVLRGKSTPMSIFAPIALRAEATPAQVDYVTRYGEALRLYRSGAMQDASNEWAKLDSSALTDWHVGAAAVMAARAAVESNPPGNP
ncbi:MAG: adenylate/guanylate cyclase domain-containing protein, partial [Casimicrobiaceae bacterium]